MRDALNDALLTRLNDGGRLFLVSTKVEGGRTALRVAIGGVLTQEAHVEAAWAEIAATATALLREEEEAAVPATAAGAADK